MSNIYLVGGTGYIINLANVVSVVEEENGKVRIVGNGNAQTVLEGEQAVAFLWWVREKMGVVNVEKAFKDYNIHRQSLATAIARATKECKG